MAAVLIAGLAAATVAGAMVTSSAPSTAVIALPAARFLVDACAVAAAGLAVLRWLVLGANRRDVDAVRAGSTRAAVAVAGTWAALALVVLWLQAAELSDRPPGAVEVGTVVDYLDAVASGRAALVTAVFAVLFGVTALRGWPDELLAVFAVLGLVSLPITGHAATAVLHEVAVLSVATHAAAAAAWVGGLAALVAAAGARRALLVTALPRFSRLAGWCVVALAASGALNALARLGSPQDLVDTGYGRIVMVKTALLLVLVALGAWIRTKVLPAVVAHRATRLRAYAAVELALMAVALGLAAALTRGVP